MRTFSCFGLGSVRLDDHLMQLSSFCSLVRKDKIGHPPRGHVYGGLIRHTAGCRKIVPSQGLRSLSDCGLTQRHIFRQPAIYLDSIILDQWRFITIILSGITFCALLVSFYDRLKEVGPRLVFCKEMNKVSTIGNNKFLEWDAYLWPILKHMLYGQSN